MDENKKRTPYEEWLDEIAANSPFGENSVFSHTSRERQKVEAEKREREWREKSQMLTVGAQAAKEIPEKFSRGKDGRILFETIGGEGRITVVMHLCFYGGGFDELCRRCKLRTYDSMVKTQQIKDWLKAKSTAINSTPPLDPKIVMSNFSQDLVNEQCRYLMSALNEFSHTALGPDGNEYSVYFELDGEYIEEKTARAYMITNTLKSGGNYRPANNALFFVRMEAIDASARNSSMLGLLDRRKRNTPDNSIFISTLHLSATSFTHEVIVHPFWGRGLNAGLEHLEQDWSKNPKGYETIPSIRFIDFPPEEPDTTDEIKGLPTSLKIPGSIRLDKEKRKVLPPDILLSKLDSPIAWDKSKNCAWVGDATNSFFNYQKNSLVLIQEQYDAGQEMSNIPKFISEPKTVGKALSVLLLIFSTIIGLNSCKTSDCLKAEESRFAQYLYVITNDSATTSDSTKIIRTTDENGKPYTVFRNNAGQDLTFDCKRRYTKKYIRKQLGKPLRIYISDKEQRQYKYWRNSVYEEWIYPLNIEYHPNKKPFICKILVLRFEGSSNKLRRQRDCPQLKCHDYSFYGGGEGCYDLIFGIINSDSFDIKYPYILKNEQVWFFCN